MPPYARHTHVLGLAAISLLLLAGCESNTAPGAIGNSAPLPRASTDDARDQDANTSVVVGTGDPTIDVPAVQAAVDRGGSVRLEGHFSFDTPPNPSNAISPDLAGFKLPKSAEVKITHAVSISGEDEERGAPTTIDGGSIPFYVEAPGQAVAIRRLRFVRPTSHAVFVFAARGLEITHNTVVGLKVFNTPLNGAVSIITAPGIPRFTTPGKPGNVTGDVVIAHNDFDLAGGTVADNVLGVTVFSAGDSATPVAIRVSQNKISNTTEPMINFRRIVGRVMIDHNVLTTGTVGVPGARGEVIRVANLGSYRIAHNRIECQWAGIDDGEGIGVFSQIMQWPMEHAVVVDNDVTMAPPAGSTFGPFSAGIAVFGFANHNVVAENRVRGTAFAALSIPSFPLPPQAPASPAGNAFIRNRLLGFAASNSNIFIAPEAVGTRIVEWGSHR